MSLANSTCQCLVNAEIVEVESSQNHISGYPTNQDLLSNART